MPPVLQQKTPHISEGYAIYGMITTGKEGDTDDMLYL